MAEDVPPPVDLWTVLDEAEQTVSEWPEWQRRYGVDGDSRTVVQGTQNVEHGT